MRRVLPLAALSGFTQRLPAAGSGHGTPLLDLKPDRALFRPAASPQAGDFQTG